MNPRCGRCNGFLDHERPYLRDPLYPELTYATRPTTRCVNCGDILDAVIAAARRGQAPAVERPGVGAKFCPARDRGLTGLRPKRKR